MTLSWPHGSVSSFFSISGRSSPPPALWLFRRPRLKTTTTTTTINYQQLPAPPSTWKLCTFGQPVSSPSFPCIELSLVVPSFSHHTAIFRFHVTGTLALSIVYGVWLSLNSCSAKKRTLAFTFASFDLAAFGGQCCCPLAVLLSEAAHELYDMQNSDTGQLACVFSSGTFRPSPSPHPSANWSLAASVFSLPASLLQVSSRFCFFSVVSKLWESVVFRN